MVTTLRSSSIPSFKSKHCWHCFTFHDKTNLISLLKCFNLPLSTLGGCIELRPHQLRADASLLLVSAPQNGPVFFVVSLLFHVKSFHCWPQVLNLTVLSQTEPATFYEMNFLKSGPVLNQWVVQFCPPLQLGLGSYSFSADKEDIQKFKEKVIN